MKFVPTAYDPMHKIISIKSVHESPIPQNELEIISLQCSIPEITNTTSSVTNPCSLHVLFVEIRDESNQTYLVENC